MDCLRIVKIVKMYDQSRSDAAFYSEIHFMVSLYTLIITKFIYNENYDNVYLL